MIRRQPANSGGVVVMAARRGFGRHWPSEQHFRARWKADGNMSNVLRNKSGGERWAVRERPALHADMVFFPCPARRAPGPRQDGESGKENVCVSRITSAFGDRRW